MVFPILLQFIVDDVGDERNAKLRTNAYEKEGIHGGVVTSDEELHLILYMNPYCN